MTGRNVNLFISNWTDDGITVPVPRYSVDISIQWIDENGQEQSHNETYQFPNALSGVPLRRLKRYMEEIILREARIQLGIDEAE